SWRRSASGCFSALIISPTTTLLKSAATGAMPSTSSPAMVKACAKASLSKAGSTNCLSQFSENCIYFLAELFQETQIVLKEQSQVINAITQHGQTLHTQTKGKSPVLLAIDADMTKYLRMHHAATADFQPATIPAHIHFCGRLGKWKKRRPKTHL